MTEAEEAQFEVKAEKHFNSHRELRNGRNFQMWNHVPIPGENERYRNNFDATFPNSPGVGL